MIRPARTNDAPSIRLLLQSVPNLWHESWRNDVLERALAAAEGLAFVWEDEDLIQGFICAHDLGFHGLVSQLVVADDVQRKGIGKELVLRVQNEFVERGCALLIADTTPESESFYRGLGWQPPQSIFLKRRLMQPTI